MKIKPARISDAEAILALQKLAFQEEAKRYSSYDIPPLHQSIDELKAEYKTHLILKATIDDEIVGTVRAYEESGTCFICRLAVRPDMQNSGIGTALMCEIEKQFSPTRFELFVGGKSENNIHLYTKLGYSVFKTGREGGDSIETLFMGKWNEGKRSYKFSGYFPRGINLKKPNTATISSAKTVKKNLEFGLLL